jgi:hypothetical protein
MNTQNGYEDCEDRKGDVTEAVPDCGFASIHTISFVSMMKKFIPRL